MPALSQLLKTEVAERRIAPSPIRSEQPGPSSKIQLAVCGLDCLVRFTLTAGHRGDGPQAARLVEGLPAKVVMADTAYDADHFRQAFVDKGARYYAMVSISVHIA